jgi:hypothetical protein
MQHVAPAIVALEESARRHAATVALPANLVERMRREFEREPTLPWEDSLARALAS